MPDNTGHLELSREAVEEGPAPIMNVKIAVFGIQLQNYSTIAEMSVLLQYAKGGNAWKVCSFAALTVLGAST